MPRKTVVADVKTSSQHVSLPTKLPCQGSKLTNSHDNLPNQTSNPNLWPKIKKKKKKKLILLAIIFTWFGIKKNTLFQWQTYILHG